MCVIRWCRRAAASVLGVKIKTILLPVGIGATSVDALGAAGIEDALLSLSLSSLLSLSELLLSLSELLLSSELSSEESLDESLSSSEDESSSEDVSLSDEDVDEPSSSSFLDSRIELGKIFDLRSSSKKRGLSEVNLVRLRQTARYQEEQSLSNPYSDAAFDDADRCPHRSNSRPCWMQVLVENMVPHLIWLGLIFPYEVRWEMLLAVPEWCQTRMCPGGD